MSTWPADLPTPLRDSYGLQPVDQVIRTPMDAGNVRMRRRYRNVPTSVPCTWLFTGAEMALFEGWYESEIEGGAASFDVPMLNGLGLSTVSARFSGVWASKLIGLSHQVSATLLVSNRPTLSADATAVLLTYGIADVTAAIPALHTWLHTTMPAESTWRPS